MTAELGGELRSRFANSSSKGSTTILVSHELEVSLVNENDESNFKKNFCYLIEKVANFQILFSYYLLYPDETLEAGLPNNDRW